MSNKTKKGDSQENSPSSKSHKMAVQLTTEQFQELLSRIPSQAGTNKNFTRCTLNYNGERDYNKVDEFITGITIYKKIEGISDDDALAGLPLLLKDIASTWWFGVQPDIKNWSSALNAIRLAFAPKLQPYEVYLKLFQDQQGSSEPIDTFLCRKRALLAMLPAKRHKEEEQLDFVYGLLKIDIKKKIARTEVKTFSDLVDKARHLESLEEAQPSASDTIKSTSTNAHRKARKTSLRCAFCLRKGHTFDICRTRLSLESKLEKPTTSTVAKPVINCYGCGAPGVFRSNCDICKAKDSPPKPIQFYAYNPPLRSVAKVPTIEVMFDGKKGHAHIDTAARTSIAGPKLYALMKQAGITGTRFKTIVSLADGTKKLTELVSVDTNVTIGERSLPITFTVFPDADNRTLLGIDFLAANNIILDLGQQVWFYGDTPNKKYDFLRIHYETTSTAVKKLTFQDPEESLSDFLKWTSSLTMLSPIADTPPHLIETQDDKPEPTTWKLIKMDTPPPPVRPREPRAIKETRPEDPRIKYIPINPLKLYAIEFPLQPHEAKYLSKSEKEQFNELLDEFHINYAMRAGSNTFPLAHSLSISLGGPTRTRASPNAARGPYKTAAAAGLSSFASQRSSWREGLCHPPVETDQVSGVRTPLQSTPKLIW